ncbi:MAG: 3-keto-5-aminohexanoate cleavage protein [Thalassobaculales bacterium]
MIPVTLASAPNGGRRTPADHPAIPVTAADLARTAAAVVEAGAAMMHVHVRKPDASHTLDPDAYRDAFAAIRGAVGDRLVLQMTSEALGVYRPAEQIAAVQAVRPEFASAAVRELAPTAAEEPAFAAFLAWAAANRVAIQFIVYDAADCARLDSLHRRGLIPWSRIAVLFVLGRYSPGQRSSPADLIAFLPHAGPPVADWMVCAFGPDEGACAVAAGALGGGARVGFENNLHLVDGRLAPDNAALIAQAAAALASFGRRPMTAAEYRERLAMLV